MFITAPSILANNISNPYVQNTKLPLSCTDSELPNHIQLATFHDAIPLSANVFRIVFPKNWVSPAGHIQCCAPTKRPRPREKPLNSRLCITNITPNKATATPKTAKLNGSLPHSLGKDLYAQY